MIEGLDKGKSDPPGLSPAWVWVPTMVASFLLVAALALPFISIQFDPRLPEWVPESVAIGLRKWASSVGGLPTGEHYLWTFVDRLFGTEEYVLGTAILTFAIVLPAVTVLLTGVLLSPLPGPAGQLTLQRAIRWSTHWSMGGVFLVALFIIIFQAEHAHFTIKARVGLHCYVAFTVLSLLVSSLVRQWPVGTGYGRHDFRS